MNSLISASRGSLATGADIRKLADILKRYGLEIPRTRTGRISTTNEELRRVSAGTDAQVIIEAVIEYRKRSFHAGLARKLLDRRDTRDRIHPRIHPVGAITGRMSVEDPPLQQMPLLRRHSGNACSPTRGAS